MENMIILKIYPGIKYALVARIDPATQRATEYIAAYMPVFNGNNISHWSHGHYFDSDLYAAMRYIVDKMVEEALDVDEREYL